MSELPASLYVPEALSGMRLDAALAELLPDYSRSRLKQWIENGEILVEGQVVKPRFKISSDQQLQLNVEPGDENERCQPEAIELDVVYEDESLIVINKPANFVVHPAAGHPSGTLQNALLHYDASLSALPRAGIVHRLDKDTTGLMVVARSLSAHKYLVDQIQQREVSREYQALVHGVLTGGGTVDEPIGRHHHERIRMAVREDGRPSVTHYRVLDRFRVYSHIQLKLETGRTHQIRVHMQHIKHPIVGDPVYAGRPRIPPQADPVFIEQLRAFKRQALHAWRLSLAHPVSGEMMSWEADIPADMQQLIVAMKQDLEVHS